MNRSNKWEQFDSFRHLIIDVVENSSVSRLNNEKHLRPVILQWIQMYMSDIYPIREIKWMCSSCVKETFSFLSSYEFRTRKHEENKVVAKPTPIVIEEPTPIVEAIEEVEVNVALVGEDELPLGIVIDEPKEEIIEPIKKQENGKRKYTKKK